MAKDLEISFLLDFYGDMLTEKQREVIEFYYNEDLSLSEIADNEGITRQGCAIPLNAPKRSCSIWNSASVWQSGFARCAAGWNRFARRPSASRITTSTMCIPAIFPRIHRRL